MGKPQPEVRLFAGVKLDVGPTDADAFDIDEQLPAPGHGGSDIPYTSEAWAFDDESAHYGRTIFCNSEWQ
jgi:hypothetical protein